MRELNIISQKELYAGGLSTAAYAAIVSGISFVIGILDGIARPFRCR